MIAPNPRTLRRAFDYQVEVTTTSGIHLSIYTMQAKDMADMVDRARRTLLKRDIEQVVTVVWAEPDHEGCQPPPDGKYTEVFNVPPMPPTE